ncbi:MAG TPA: prenyltransferase [Pyrinomonadaceae bacterium]|nr:prenyltransferase [Pyrinomonadaceae bacterium]
MRFLLKVSRPRFWFYIFGPYIVGLVAAAEYPQQLDKLTYLLFGLYFTFPANLLVYGVNDIFDYETDKLNEKKTDYETLVAPERRSKLWLAIFVTNIAFAGILFLGNLPAVIAGAAFLFFSIFYSAPPIRAKAKPFLDSAFNILYVMPGVFSYSLVTGQFPPASIVIAAGCWTAAMHAYSAIPDIDADKAAGLKTIATVCGPYFTLGICAVLYATAGIIAAEYLGLAGITIGFAYILLMVASARSVKTGTLFKLYRSFPLINVAAGFVIFCNIALDKLL